MPKPLPPGKPGIPARWTSSAKSGVGTAITNACRVWFALSHGIVNEVYHPFIDRANTHDMGLLVTDGLHFFSEEKRDTVQEIEPIAQGVPGYRVRNTCKQGRYRITKTIVADPARDTLLQHVRFEPLQGELSDYHLYVLLAPHVDNQGAGNTGWVGDYKGVPMLFATRQEVTLTLACSAPWRGASCGYVGTSDGWQDIHAHKRMTWFYPEARDGNIALTGEIDLVLCDGQFLLALGFGSSAQEAGQQARASLLRDFGETVRDYVRGWQDFQAQCPRLGAVDKKEFPLVRTSLAVLKTHEGKRFPGGLIASLSIPWGFAHGDNDLGGYHLIWPRDQVEAAGALLAAGDTEGARNALHYLMSTQEPDGHWPQNMWLDGTPYWQGIQADETAFVLLLADALRRQDALNHLDPWPTLRKAVAFLVRNGPVTQQDRWEENSGYSPFTLATEIAALLAAADFADINQETPLADYLRQTADTWNANIERWTYVTDTPLARQVGVDGYYIRIAPSDVAETGSPAEGMITLQNRPPGQDRYPVAEIVSPDALALVRFGLRAADDPRIRNTVRVLDALLKTETATGPVWHRYTHDGYGEHADGSPYDGTGIGRGWPLLAGERAHYELAAGNREEAERLLKVMAAQTSPGGLIPEQIWDAPDIPKRELFNGQPSGSAMPLVWAHAEYLKLVRSLHDGQIFDMPPQTVQRYQVEQIGTPFAIWRFSHQCRRIPTGLKLRIEAHAPAEVIWTEDGWQTQQQVTTRDTGLGLHVADLPTDQLPVGTMITFTFYWLEVDRWEGRNFDMGVGEET